MFFQCNLALTNCQKVSNLINEVYNERPKEGILEKLGRHKQERIRLDTEVRRAVIKHKRISEQSNSIDRAELLSLPGGVRRRALYKFLLDY